MLSGYGGFLEGLDALGGVTVTGQGLEHTVPHYLLP